MTAANVVRFRVKPGREEEFIAAHRKVERFEGMQKAFLIMTGERTFCIVGIWNDMDSLAAGRPTMIALLDTFRDTLEDLGGELGVTDPVSGQVVLEIA